jgi:hypothetical protein
MAYQIYGSQGFSCIAATVAEGITKATAAERRFSPIRITGPGGQITLAALRARAKADKADKAGKAKI